MLYMLSFILSPMNAMTAGKILSFHPDDNIFSSFFLINLHYLGTFEIKIWKARNIKQSRILNYRMKITRSN